MKTIKGPALLIAQFAGDEAPLNNLPDIAGWVASMGYKGLQMPSWDGRFFDLKKCAESQDYADETTGTLKEKGLELTELSTHLQGQLVCVHPAYDSLFDGFAPPAFHHNPKARQEWAVDQMMLAAKASRRLGLKVEATFSGSLGWPFVYPWPQRPGGLVEEIFSEQARRWKPILDAHEENGIDVAFELHPGEDIFDGTSFELFLEALGGHKRCTINYDASHFIKQGLDYVEFIDVYHDRITGFHVKDAEFNPSGRQGFYSGWQPWLKRAARDRSLGDGQVDFNQVFSKLTEYGFEGWAVYEWECCMKDPQQAAEQGAPFIESHIIKATTKTFDDFAATGADRDAVRKTLGI